MNCNSFHLVDDNEEVDLPITYSPKYKIMYTQSASLIKEFNEKEPLNLFKPVQQLSIITPKTQILKHTLGSLSLDALQDVVPAANNESPYADDAEPDVYFDSESEYESDSDESDGDDE